MVIPDNSTTADGDSESSSTTLLSAAKIPKDSFNSAYIIHFILGLGYLLPWNAFITAVDYFSYLYPDASVDRIFAVAYFLVTLICIAIIVLYSNKSDVYIRINVGLALFVVALLVVPVIDLVYIKGRVGLYDGFYVTVGAISVAGLADGLVQGGVIGAAGELPERYMQAVVAGTAASGQPATSTSGTPMGLPGKSTNDGNSESCSLLSAAKIPKDSFNSAYIIHFILGLGYLLPWNTLIIVVDYFSYLYPSSRIDRLFNIVYMPLNLFFVILVILSSDKSNVYVRINVGPALFIVALLVVPVMDMVYIKGQVGLYDGFYMTVGASLLAALADALVEWGLLGLLERYMQAVVAGTVASGVLVSVLRILTKSVYSQDAYGLRKSANLYFIVGIVVMVICIILYNVAHRLPVIKHYRDLKILAVNDEREEKGFLTGAAWRSTLWNIVGRVKWYGFGTVLIYIVTLAIFPGYITEDVHSEILKDWYPILLITGFNVFDLVGKCLTPVYLLENSKIAVGWCVARLLFFPLFLGCLHGPEFFRTEIPVTVLTCLLGLTNGYFTSVLMILAPKVVQLQHSESAGIVMVLFLIIGLAAGSVVAWFWVI